MGKKKKDKVQQSQRVQTSILNAPEKKILNWLAARQPDWVTSDMLTAIGSVGALMIGTGYALSGVNINFLWLSTLGLFVNWYGDSLDGTLARYRNAQRPKYGFFIDHMVDCFNEVAMFVGFGLSPFVKFNLGLMVLACYFMISIYVYISAHLKGEFKLTYAKCGPTEIRFIAVIVNTGLLFVPAVRQFALDITLFGHDISLSLFDIVAIVLVVGMLLLIFINFIKDAKQYAKLEPPYHKGR